MNILDVKLVMNPETFEPMIITTIEMPVELMLNTSNGGKEQAEIIGRKFISAYKDYKENKNSKSE